MFLFQTTDSAGDAQAESNDAGDPTPGYGCFGDARVADSQLIATWAAGERVTLFPAETGVALNPGRKFILQMHYGSQNEDVPDRTTVNLQISPNVTTPATLVFYTDTNINLAAGIADTADTQSFPISTDQTVYGVITEQLLHGAAAEMDVVHGSSPRCLQKVARADFRWREVAFLQTPQPLTAGDLLQVTCHYSTQGLTDNTVYGSGTANEMCRVGLYTTAP